MYLRRIYSSSSEPINAIFNSSDRPHSPLPNKCRIIRLAYMINLLAKFENVFIAITGISGFLGLSSDAWKFDN
ncbi:uncharacterized protein OCT59_014716 [Rhizophagus irregularis]|uniref:uncharacterized protein n=1 Tax=Rhizophagus irregularis TaxID=588596 RepID=UPI0019EA878B|nr:hypothetical protein OCT59_014716 [Rhizophagus irregularis]GBC44120.2 hypothetical protein RIR_jg15217.t1 [Rhizophagus irregularis DAOM 181602=DAOM 197198]